MGRLCRILYRPKFPDDFVRETNIFVGIRYGRFHLEKGENITVRHHVVFYADGILGTMDWENEGTEEKDIAQHDINVSAMNYEAEIQESYPDKEIKLLSFSVSVGPRNITYYVIDRKNLTQMFFINAFNVFELFEIQGVTTAKTTVERDTAVINRRETFYDRTIEKSMRCKRQLFLPR